MSNTQILARFPAVQPGIRKRFPQLEKDIHGNRRIYLNSGAGTLTVDTASRAMGEASTWLNSLAGDIYPAEVTTKNFHWQIRQIAADFLNAARPEEISFHASTSQALLNLSLSLRGLIRGRNNLVVTDLDHMANVSPWESVAGKWWGAEVRHARAEADGRLDAEQIASLVDSRTALLAIPLASNSIGTIVPAGEIIREVRKKSPACLVCVDAVHHALHGPIDVQALDCDFLAVSGYKVFGPMLGVLWGKKSILDRLAPFRVETNKDETPYKFEQGSLNNAALAALGSALQYLLWVDGEVDPGVVPPGGRPAKFRRAMTSIAAYEQEISRVVLEGLNSLDRSKIHCYGVVDASQRSRRDPTFAFETGGRSPAEVKAFLWEKHAIQVADGNHYSAFFYRRLKKDSVCRASFAHYISLDEAKAFVEALKDLSR
jgi:selenocysteine lyase/cysteine desulfurase